MPSPTFSDRELSVYSSKPVELYLFSNGDQVWAATSADEDITVNLSGSRKTATDIFVLDNTAGMEIGSTNPTITGNITFKSMGIHRTDSANTSELNRSYVNITVPRDFGVASLYSFYPPSSITAVTVFRYHRDISVDITTGDNLNLFTEFLGRVVNASGVGVSTELRCEPITTSIRRMGLSQMFQRQCPHTLYNQCEGSCRVDKASFANIKTLNATDGLVGLTLKFNTSLIETLKPLGYYNGGMVHWKTGHYNYWRWILDQPSSDTININFPVPSLDADNVNPLYWQGGDKQVTLYPGCAHTMTDCRVKFNNLVNYGGDPYIPLMNPFGGSTLY
jgi:hypothetical protein